MQLKQLEGTLAYEAAFWYLGVKDAQYPLERLGEISGDVSRKMRSLAIMRLLVAADTDGFCHNLMRSAIAREIFLRRCRDEGRPDDPRTACSRNDAILDAVAGGDAERARSLATLSPEKWRSRDEYEDDYCFFRLVHLCVLGRRTAAELEPLLVRFEKALEGAASARLEVGRALLSARQDEFDQAFRHLLSERAALVKKEKEEVMEDVETVARRHVFVEGLAVLRLAEAAGLATKGEYRYCPALARLPASKPLVDP